MTGTTIAQELPILASPILTRIYAPEDFGVLALFVAVTNIFGFIANGRYELAIVVAPEEEDAVNITALAIIIACVLSVFLLLIVIFFNNQISTILGNEEIRFWLYVMPPVVFLIGLFHALNYFNTRIKSFGTIAKVNVYKSVVSVIVKLVLGFLKTGYMVYSPAK